MGAGTPGEGVSPYGVFHSTVQRGWGNPKDTPAGSPGDAAQRGLGRGQGCGAGGKQRGLSGAMPEPQSCKQPQQQLLCREPEPGVC